MGLCQRLRTSHEKYSKKTCSGKCGCHEESQIPKQTIGKKCNKLSQVLNIPEKGDKIQITPLLPTYFKF